MTREQENEMIRTVIEPQVRGHFKSLTGIELPGELSNTFLNLTMATLTMQMQLQSEIGRLELAVSMGMMKTSAVLGALKIHLDQLTEALPANLEMCDEHVDDLKERREIKFMTEEVFKVMKRMIHDSVAKLGKK